MKTQGRPQGKLDAFLNTGSDVSPEVLAKCREVAERLRIAQSIEDITGALVAESQLDQIVSLVAAKAVELIGAEYSLVTLADWDTGEVRVIHHHGGSNPALKNLGLRLDNSLSGWVLKTGQSAAVNDPSSDARVNQNAVKAAGAERLMIVPLKVGTSVIGTLSAVNKVGGVEFNDGDVRALELLASRAAVALANAESYEQAREAEEAADAEKRKLEAVIRNVGIGVVVCDRRGIVTLANEAAHELLRVSGRNMTGWPLAEFSPPGNKSKVLQMLDELEEMGRGTRLSREMTCDLRGQKIRLSAYAIRPTVDSLEGFVVLIQDVTKDVEMVEAATDFVSMLAHELRTPLTSLNGSIGLILGGASGDVSSQTEDLLRIAQNNCARLVRLVDDLMDIGRVESGRLELRLTETSVVDCVRRAVEGLRPRVEDNGLKLVFEVKSRAKSGVPNVIADPDRLEQVVINLISNAIKFSPTGGVISVIVRHNKDTVRVAVADEGRGVPDSEKDRIFDKFYQGAKLQDGERGVGLGLPISKAIIEQHGGTIYVRDRRTKGSRFVFTLPVPPYGAGLQKDSA